MAFTEAERVQVRRWLGVPAIFVQAEPRLESAITTVQSTADGGSRADNSTELAIRGWLSDLATLETKTKGLWDIFLGTSVGDVSADAVRGMQALRSEGRRIVGHIGDALSHPPVRDVFAPARAQPYPPFDASGGRYDR